MSDDDALKQETDALQQMIEDERKLLAGFEEFIKGKVAQGVPRERAYALVAEIFRDVREIRARDRRRTFRVI
ncbi:hypothetical protein [Bradyrhizobium sp. S3.2.12]|uniref:hypothetical protein n=1 Tax=Bradyrhizobium sp. S3.2.12 TaxID=3156387 RepID=UPI0033969FE0